MIYTNSQFGLPRWHSDKESACQCRRHRLNPWVGSIPWNRKWQPTPEFLPGESHRQRSLVGYQGVSKSWTQLRDSTQTPASLTIFLYLRQYLKLCLYSTPIEQWLHMKMSSSPSSLGMWQTSSFNPQCCLVYKILTSIWKN